jgi:hypothetical protein
LARLGIAGLHLPLWLVLGGLGPVGMLLLRREPSQARRDAAAPGDPGEAAR